MRCFKEKRGVFSIFKIYMLCCLIKVSSPHYKKKENQEKEKKIFLSGPTSKSPLTTNVKDYCFPSPI